MKYNIVLEDSKEFVLTSCKTLEEARKRLKEIIKTDKELATYYNWEKIPRYEIIESE